MARKVLIVEWLGEGGIAQTTTAWATVLRSSSMDVTVASRARGEMARDFEAGKGLPKALAHAITPHGIAQAIRARRPDVVIIQNWCIPPLEKPVYRAARAVGARLVVVVHDHRLHARRFGGTTIGLRSRLQAADLLLCHTQYVAERVASLTTRSDVLLIPHPVPLALVGGRNGTNPRTGDPVAIHFGGLWRRNKGTALVAQMARRGVPPWHFQILGPGAPQGVPGALTESRFLPASELVERVAHATACVLPYSWASQSGAVVLAQALGTVPVVTAVGGIPEQITDGQTGRLVQRGATLDQWCSILDELADPKTATEIGQRAWRHIWDQHKKFAELAVAFTA